MHELLFDKPLEELGDPVRLIPRQNPLFFIILPSKHCVSLSEVPRGRKGEKKREIRVDTKM